MANQKLAAWRAGRTEEVTLPSGLTVTAKRVSIEDVLINGDIPKPLLGMIDQVRNEGGSLSIERLAEFMPLVDRTVALAIIDPPVAEIADDEHLALTEMPANDRLALFNWLMEPAAAVAPFRAQRAGAVAGAPGGDDLRDEAERDPGDRAA